MTVSCSDSIPIEEFRGRLRTEFGKWELAVGEDDSVKAKATRRRIQALSRDLLTADAASLPGLYVFVNLKDTASANSVSYIGIATRATRPIRRRVEDRFKDDSCLDVTLDGMSDERAWSIIDQRLKVAMPGTSERNRHRYVSDHLRTGRLFRRSTHILLFGSSAGEAAIRDAEAQMIASATITGVALSNRQLFRGYSSISADGRELAVDVMDRLALLGLSPGFVQQWKSALA